MLREIANDFYMNQNYNCGECILRAANKAYNLDLDERALKLASGFGAGMGLPNIKKYTDQLQIDTAIGQGTCMTMAVTVA